MDHSGSRYSEGSHEMGHDQYDADHWVKKRVTALMRWTIRVTNAGRPSDRHEAQARITQDIAPQGRTQGPRLVVSSDHPGNPFRKSPSISIGFPRTSTEAKQRKGKKFKRRSSQWPLRGFLKMGGVFFGPLRAAGMASNTPLLR
ncbi:MAG: hypothetical protein CM15mP3_04980 [Candidatus Poseidoniales archaeon]|nr:MAG: hypothetical protein CM15mP3_04980 [Candidatus Poseidoniales archaeon]